MTWSIAWLTLGMIWNIFVWIRMSKHRETIKMCMVTSHILKLQIALYIYSTVVFTLVGLLLWPYFVYRWLDMDIDDIFALAAICLMIGGIGFGVFVVIVLIGDL